LPSCVFSRAFEVGAILIHIKKLYLKILGRFQHMCLAKLILAVLLSNSKKESVLPNKLREKLLNYSTAQYKFVFKTKLGILEDFFKLNPNLAFFFGCTFVDWQIGLKV